MLGRAALLCFVDPIIAQRVSACGAAERPPTAAPLLGLAHTAPLSAVAQGAERPPG